MENDDAEPLLDRAALKTLMGGGAAADHILSMYAVAAAVAGGDPLRIHGALRDVYKRSKDDGVRKAVKRALDTPEAFRAPFSTLPGLFSWHGCGIRLHGSKGSGVLDDPYVKVRSFTFLYVPFFPLDAWEVTKMRKDGWVFHSRVPLGRGQYLLRAVAICAAIAVALVVLLLKVWDGTHEQVAIANGLDIPVHVTVNDGPEQIRVPANGTAITVWSVGSHRVTIRDDGGRIIESLDVELGLGDRGPLLNVLGAAPVFHDTVVYSGTGHIPEQSEGDFVWYAGASWSITGAEDLFREPPQSIELERWNSIVKRRYLQIEPGGWQAAVHLLQEHIGDELSTLLAVRAACAMPQREEAIAFAAAHIDSHVPVESALEIVSAALDVHTDSPALARLQTSLRRRLATAGSNAPARQPSRPSDALSSDETE